MSHQFKRQLNTTNIFFATVSSAIGSGWLFAPYYAAKIAGPLAIVAWLLGGLLLFPILLAFIMMATRFPVTGSLVRYTRCTHGKLLSFMCGWLTWLAAIMVPAIETMASIDYSSYFFPSLAITNHPGDTKLTALGILWACVLMLFFLVANLIGIRLVARINSIAGVGKLIIPSVFIIVGLYYFNSANFSLQPMVNAGIANLDTIFKAIATGGILFSAVGFRTVFEMSGEINKPKKTLFIGVFTGFFTYIAIYILLQIAFIGILPAHDFSNGWQQLTLSGDQASPLMTIAAGMGLIWLLGVLYLDAVISPASTGLINATSASRVLFSISAVGLLPKRLLKLNKAGVPWVTIIINFCLGMLFFLPFSGWSAITSFFSSLMVLNYGIGIIAMPILCKIVDQKSKLYQHIIAIIALYMAILFIHFTGWSDVWKLCLGAIVGMLVYMAYSQVTKTHESNELHNFRWLFIMLAGSVVVSYFGQYGGGTGALNLVDSCLLLALLTLISYRLGIKSAAKIETGRAIYQQAIAADI